MKELFDYEKKKSSKIDVVFDKSVEEITTKPVIKTGNSNLAIVLVFLLGAVIALYTWYKNREQENG